MSIRLYTGPMGSGKTDMLLRQIRIFRIKKMQCTLIKHSGDNDRGGVDMLTTKDGVAEKGVSSDTLAECVDAVSTSEVVGIDEGQFFPDLAIYCEKWANAGKIVVVAALDCDYKRQWFPNVQALMPKCEKVKKLNAICVDCNDKAAFTKRIVDMGDEQEVPGGFEMYSPVCRKCHSQ